MEQCRFAGSRSSDDGNVLARSNQTGDAAQDDAVIMPESDVAENRARVQLLFPRKYPNAAYLSVKCHFLGTSR